MADTSPKALAMLLMKKHGMGDKSGGAMSEDDGSSDAKDAAEDILKAIRDNDPDALSAALKDHATLSSGGEAEPMEDDDDTGVDADQGE